MNCERIEQLIPLYVGDDLDGGAAEVVRSHVGACSNCRLEVEQYQESQGWLRSCGPEFDEAALSRFKRGVMSEIDGANRRSRWLWSRFSGAQVAFASLFILLAVIAAATYAGLHKARQDREAQARQELTPERTPEPAPDAKGVVAKKAPEVEQTVKGGKRGTSDGRGLPDWRTKGQPDFTDAQWRKGHTDGIGSSAGSREPTIVSRAGQGASTGSSPTAAPVRIEIQTSDPSIRIIWFATKDTESSKSLTEE